MSSVSSLVPVSQSRGPARPAGFFQQIIATIFSALLAVGQPALLPRLHAAEPPLPAPGGTVTPLATGPLVWTDKADYAPGETATFYGLDFGRSEIVTLQVTFADERAPTDVAAHSPWTTTTDAVGVFSSTWLVSQDSFNALLLLTATGTTSGKTAKVLFSDSTGVAPAPGEALAWGHGELGSLGNGSSANSLVPVSVSALPAATPGGQPRKIKAIGGGVHHSLALADDSTLWAWGWGTEGQLGNGVAANSASPVAVSTPAAVFGGTPVQIAGGEYHSLVLLNDGRIAAWGYGGLGQLGRSTPPGTAFVSSSVPVLADALPGGLRAIAIAAGGYHSLALAENGQVWSWGYNYSGQLGDNSRTSRSTPTQVVTAPWAPRTIVAISAGEHHSVALANDGTIWAWGYGYNGELGNGTFDGSLVPVPVTRPPALPAGVSFNAISAGGYHTLAQATNGTLWSWGRGGNGQLGDGGWASRYTPVQVAGLSGTVAKFSAGFYHSFMLDSAGNASGWGFNGYGQLGDRTTTSRALPTALIGVPVGKKIVALGLGFHSLAITGAASNSAPTAVGQSVSTAEDVPVGIVLAGTDPENQALTYTITTTPMQGSLSGTLPNLTYTPTANYNGPDSFTFTVTDSVAATSAPATVSITVTPVNDAPNLANPGDKSVAEGSPLGFTLAATDIEGHALTYTMQTGGLLGMTLSAGTGVFAWTPTEPQGPGSYPVTFRVTDNGTPNRFDEETITITVNEVNVAPVLSGVPAEATIPELAAYGFTATATDGDVPVQTLTFSLVGGPSGAAFNATTGVFSWTPTEAQGPGDYLFAVRVSDGVTNTDQAITLHVTEVNVAPVLANVPAEATIPELAAYGFTATATDGDAPGQTLTFSLVGAPAGATINASTGVFSWTPTEAQGPGDYPFMVRVSDGVTNTDQAIMLHVTELNVAPVLANVPAEATIPELAAYGFTATATDGDSPAQALTFSLVGGPTGAAIHATTGVFSWTPTEAQGAGDYLFAVRVSDGVANTDQAITLHVTEVNAAPVLANPGNKAVNELELLAFSLSATDGDTPANTIAYSIQTGLEPGMVLNATTGAFTWTPTEAQGPGVYTVTFRATDNGSPALSHEQTITITVTEVNVAPVLADVPTEATIPELVPYSFDAGVTDPDAPVQTLTFSLVGGPTGATIDANTGIFSWTPSETQGPATHNFSVRVSDGVVNVDLPVTLHVTEVNTVPVLTNPGNKSVDELALLAFSLSATDGDLPANALSYTITSGSVTGMALSPAGAFAWTPSETQGPGSYPVTFRVTDNGTPALFHEQSITITVSEVNVAPVLSGVPVDATIPELAAYGFTASATDGDSPAQTLTFSLVGAPSGAAINATTGVFSWTPTEAQGPGDYPFTVRVSDGVANTDQAITLHVTEVNVAPVLANPGNKSVNELNLLAFSLSATDADLPANALSYTITSAPVTGMALTPAGAFTWTPSEAQGPGVFNVTFRATDNGTPALHHEQAITITVNEVNLPPALVNPGNQSIAWGNPLTFTLAGSDPDLPANTLNYSISAGTLPGMSVNPNSGAFSWTPTNAQTGSASVTFRVADGGGLYVEQSITINVGLRATALVYDGHISAQYSDKPLLRATLTDAGGGALGGTPVVGRTIGFTIGTQSPSPSPSTNATGSASTSTMALTQAPGSYPLGSYTPNSYTVASTFAGDSDYLAASDSDPFTITREDARVTYTGAMFAASNSATDGRAVVTLAATIQDITAAVGDLDSDPNAGDILKATIKFINRDSNTVIATVPIGLVTIGDNKTGVATYNWNVDIGTADSAQYTVGMRIEGYYTRDSSVENTVVTVSKPINGSITGGGYVVLTTSAGLKAGDVNTKNNLGFNVKNQKSGPKGNINTIIRRTEADGVVHVYQIKGNAMTSLATQLNATGTGGTATFNGKANIQDITNPLLPVSVDGNATLQVKITDRGEPGNTDSIAITVWAKDGGLWFSNQWSGTQSTEAMLGGGNVVVR